MLVPRIEAQGFDVELQPAQLLEIHSLEEGDAGSHQELADRRVDLIGAARSWSQKIGAAAKVFPRIELEQRRQRMGLGATQWFDSRIRTNVPQRLGIAGDQ